MSYRCPNPSYSGPPYQNNQHQRPGSSSSLSFVKSSSSLCKQPLSPLAGCDGRRKIFNLSSSSNLNADDGPVFSGGHSVVSSANFSGISKLNRAPNKPANMLLGGTSSLTSSLASICSLSGTTGGSGRQDRLGGQSGQCSMSGTGGGVDGNLSKGRHFSLPVASSSLLDSYVNGSDSPLRNLYCQCKHHAAK